MPILITIITPTMGSPHLRKLLQSLNELEGLGRNYEIEHFIAVDNAPVYGIKVNTMLNEVTAAKGIERYLWNIPFSSGAGNYKGHRIYAGISQFVNGEYTLFLDDDNYFYPRHILNFLEKGKGYDRGIDRNGPIIPDVDDSLLPSAPFQGAKKVDYDWQFSLREIVDEEDRSICPDQCESLGHLAPVYYDKSEKPSHLIDTNCYFIKSRVLKEISTIWNRPAKYDGGDPDRLLGQLLMMRYPKYRSTREHTVAYRVGNGDGGVSPDLFLKGNQIVSGRFGLQSAWGLWKKPIIYLIHFNPQQTQRIIERIYSGNRDAETGFKQWQLNLFDCEEIRDKYLILDAYRARFIPSGSVVWIHMCNPGDLPREIMERGDLNKILYTIESPNIRHQAQWNDADFLSKYFTKVITYWDWNQGLDQSGRRYQYYPFIHRCDMHNPGYRQLINQVCRGGGKENREKSAAIVLENRAFDEKYQINGIELRAQDALRKKAVKSIAKFLPVVCYGDSWKGIGKESQKISVRETPSRFLDKDMTIDYYKKHYFAIVIENCDAVGYVSEKIYDVWMASGIPIYYGNIDDRLRDFLGRDIPIDKMMIDMKKIGVENIGDYISELYVDEIEEMRALIEAHKERILENVGIREYAKMIIQTIKEFDQS